MTKIANKEENGSNSRVKAVISKTDKSWSSKKATPTKYKPYRKDLLCKVKALAGKIIIYWLKESPNNEDWTFSDD